MGGGRGLARRGASIAIPRSPRLWYPERMEADRAGEQRGPDLPSGAQGEPSVEKPGPAPQAGAATGPLTSPAAVTAPPIPKTAPPVAQPVSIAPDFKRRVWRPAILFVVTCLSTFWVGVANGDFLTALSEPGGVLAEHWPQGLLYMSAVMGILLAHEMGHFLQAVRYRVPASYPYFIPMPLTPIGTMGAVILMRGGKANRRELFDIGLSGPWAGLVVIVPLAVLGVLSAEAVPFDTGDEHWGHPLLLQWLVSWLRPHDPPGTELLMSSSPLLLASWVGMFVTGLNMIPVGQLDGGHVAYALLGRKAHWLSFGTIGATLLFSVIVGQYGFTLMAALVTMLGIRHPETADDRAALGWPRRLIGSLSLAIPIVCLTPFPIYFS